MSGPGGRPERVVHQDYIVRQRYSNALPPPPGAPKLLDIPLNGMATYTMPVYAERMLKAQPLNIEADAFLGMPIDLVGMPGVFEGDESSIQSPLVTPSVHPHDRPLLRPLKSLGKPKNEVADISFLRRTQYVAEDRSRIEGSGRTTTQVKRRKLDTSKEHPMHILRSVIKGFDVANPESAYTGPDNSSSIRGLSATFAENEAWKHPKHPSKPNLKAVDTYPLLPDLSAFTEDDNGGYAVLKFIGNPTDVTTRHDSRLESCIFQTLRIAPDVVRDYQDKLAVHKANPDRVPPPSLPTMNYKLFLPADDNMTKAIKRKRDIYDPERDDSSLYTDAHYSAGATETKKNCFKLNHIRGYESGVQQTFAETPYQEVAIALHDGEGEDDPDDGMSKAAYFYPISAKTQLKPRRAAQLAQLGRPGARTQAVAQDQEDDEDSIDVLALQFRDMDSKERAHRKEVLARLDRKGAAGEDGAEEGEGED